MSSFSSFSIVLAGVALSIAGCRNDTVIEPYVDSAVATDLKQELRGLTGVWFPKSREGRANCPDGNPASVALRHLDREGSDFEAAGYAPPAAGDGAFVQVDCAVENGFVPPYTGPWSEETTLPGPAIFALFAEPRNGLCRFDVLPTETESSQADPNRVFCQDGERGPNRISAKLTEYRRRVPVEAGHPDAAKIDLAQFDAVADAAACTASLALEGAELVYAYDCEGAKATFRFTR